MHGVHVFHRFYAKNKQFLMLFSPFSPRSINHFTSKVVLRMTVETKMLFTSYLQVKGCQILFSAVYVIYCFKMRTQLQEQCFASKPMKELHFPDSGRNQLLPSVERAMRLWIVVIAIKTLTLSKSVDKSNRILQDAWPLHYNSLTLKLLVVVRVSVDRTFLCY